MTSFKMVAMRIFSAVVVALTLVSVIRAQETLHTRDRYTLHPGDVVELTYRLSPELNQVVTLEPDGYASLNIAGDVKLSGLTKEQAKNLIMTKVSARLNAPEINLVLKDFQKPYVVVGGEVQLPGKIELRQNMTAMQALLLAGGAKQSAEATRVVLFRHIDEEVGEVHVLNLDKITKKKSLEQDMLLQPGDMLLVPSNKLEKFSRYMRAVNFGTFMSPSSF
jgi:polysaccharide export outer membrane protein